MKSDSDNPDLIQLDAEKYGEKYHDHLMEQYKICVEMADRISSRRVKVNSFFLGVNTGIVALVGWVKAGSADGEPSPLYWLTGVAGVALCYMWYQLIRSYRQLNDWKYSIVCQLEQLLPARPYYVERERIVRAGRARQYVPFTYTEIGVPWVFLFIHVVIVLYCLPWKLFLEFWRGLGR